MSYTYAYNTRDIKFILKEWLPLEEVLSFDRYKEDYSVDDVDMIVDQVLKVAKDILAPIADEGETIGATWENGQTHIPPSWGKAIRFLQDQGWGASNQNTEEVGIPITIYGLLDEMMAAANPAIMPYVGAGGIVAYVIGIYGSEELKKKFQPNLFSGKWGGTMCLTEPGAGTDVGDMLSKAYPTDDPRIFKIKGQKIFITAGDRDDVENIIHLYLARIDGAAPGTKGLSLFLMPKYWINEDGSFSDNDVQCIGIEHKMGLKGQVTAQLVSGENNNCRGWLLGAPPNAEGKGQGMAQMFNMMNAARVDTGRLATAVAANAYWNAKNYGKERIQGRPLTNPKAGRVTINKHEDVKRMYMLNKATTEACRAMLAKCYYYEDVAGFDSDPERRKWAHGKLEMLTPLCKAYPSDEAWGLIAESLQSYGGYGYCEEYPAANAARDVKIWSLWEGTNFIQSLDLMFRKFMQENGTIWAGVLKEIDDFIAAHKGKLDGLEREIEHLEKALAAFRGIQGTLFQFVTGGKLGLAGVYGRRVLTATAQLYCGYLMMDQAVIAKKRMAELGEGHFDYNFYLGKVLATRYYLNNVVPNVWHVAELIKIGDTSILEAPDEIFDY